MLLEKSKKSLSLNYKPVGMILKNWCLSNHMFIHIGKTSLMTAGSRRTVGNISMEIFINGEIVKEVENQKLFGVIIDKSLSWDKLIDVVCLNVTRRNTLM